MMLQHPFFTTALHLEAKKALSSILPNVMSSEVSRNPRKCFLTTLMLRDPRLTRRLSNVVLEFG